MSYYIYKICCDDCPEFVYVGSTKAFRQRKNSHKKDYNRGDTRKLYTTIRENGGWDNWRMAILEDCGEITFIEARIKEEEWRLKLNANLNSHKCYRTEEERKEDRKEYNNEYRENNKEYFKEYDKEYREKNKEYKKEYLNEYYQKNKEKIKEDNKEYKEKNKERTAQPYTCECGRTFRIDGKSKHEQSLIHKQFIEQKNNSNI